MRYFIGIALVVVAVLIPVLAASLPARAEEPEGFPEEECQRYGVCELGNLLDPADPNYGP
jgi:hypothetical protein